MIGSDRRMMKKGGSSGGGQSSLGYLFGNSDYNNKQKNSDAPRGLLASPTTPIPPYGIDVDDEKLPQASKFFIIRPVQGHNSGNIIADRPSTKVRSAPGGDSSLGYLFGDK